LGTPSLPIFHLASRAHSSPRKKPFTCRMMDNQPSAQVIWMNCSMSAVRFRARPPQASALLQRGYHGCVQPCVLEAGHGKARRYRTACLAEHSRGTLRADRLPSPGFPGPPNRFDHILHGLRRGDTAGRLEDVLACLDSGKRRRTNLDLVSRS
jgi:hypothetical protein